MRGKFLFAAALLASAFVVSSCAKSDDPAKPMSINTTPSAKIEGVVYYVPDVTANPAVKKLLPSDIKITAFADNTTLLDGAAGKTELKVVYDKATGKYSIGVPVNTNLFGNTDVDIYFSSIVADYKDAVETAKYSWSPSFGNMTTLTVTKDELFIFDVEYTNDNEIIEVK